MYKLIHLYLLLVTFTAACNQDKQSDAIKFPSLSKAQSVSVKYFPNGDLYIVESYQNGKLDGPVVGFFENKRVNISGYYKAGKREGTWLFFTPEGKLRRQVEFSDDKAIGGWTDSTQVVD